MSRAIILATSATTPLAKAAIEAGERPRIDYLDLQSRLSADLIDYSVYDVPPYRVFEKVDRLSRLAWGQALYAQRHWNDYDVVFSLSEDVALSLAFLLRLRGLHPRHTMVAHNILSARKIPIVRMIGVMDRFDKIIVLSSAAVDRTVQTYGVRPERVQFMMDAIDETFWRPGPSAEVEPDFILSVGQARRDYSILLAAIGGLPLRLRIQAGSQWHMGYESNLKKSRMPDNVELGGFISYCDLRALYERAAFVVIPLQPGAHHSAGSVSVKEAMAMGKAVIVAAGDGLEDYVHHNETGLHIPPGDPVPLRQAIMELLSDPERTQEMGRCARALLEREMPYDRKIDWLASLAL